MKKLLLIFGILLLTFNLFGQKLKSYDKNGKVTKSVSEYVDMKMSSDSSLDVSAETKIIPSVLIGIILGPVYNITYTTVKNALEKRQKSFTAGYSGSREFSNRLFKRNNSVYLYIERYAINSLAGSKNDKLVAQYKLSLMQEGEYLLVKLESVQLTGAKARYKKGDYLSISIDIKAIPDSTNVKSKMTGGEGIINIPIIKVSERYQYFKSIKYGINEIRLNGINSLECNTIKFEAAITETNITRVDPSIVQTAFINSGSDIQTLLKKAFGVSDDK